MKFSLPILSLSAFAASFASATPIPETIEQLSGDHVRRNLRSTTGAGVGSSTSSCNNTLILEYDPSTLVDTENAVGKTQRVPVNVPGSNALPGSFTMAITDIIDSDDVNQCLFTGAIKLDPRSDGGFANQIVLQGSCGADNAVFGGVGLYEGIYGRQYYQSGSTEGMIEVVVEYCMPATA